MNDKIEKLTEIIRNSDNIVFFGGAGCSVESGIPDFRSANGIFMDKNNEWVNVGDTTESNIPDFRSSQGLYEIKNKYKYSPEVMLSHSFFKGHTEDFFQFYKEKMIYRNAKPNKAHYSLAKLEELGRLKAVITQNIDGLHQEAGSKNVIELHGSVHRNYCTKCRKSFGLDYIVNSNKVIPHCDECGSIVKPDVVLYEESLDMDVINKAIYYVRNAEVLIIGGTSLVVYPAASLVQYFNGKHLILINKTTTDYDSRASLVIYDSIGKVLGEAVE